MINQGFNIEEVYLHSALPDSIDILVISELRAPLSAGEMSYLQEFINRGGNLFVLGGPGRQDEPDYRTVWSSFYAGTVGAANPVTSG